jgi:hypothetical protein
VSTDEIAAIIARLQQAQRALAAGEFQPFELLSGAMASEQMAKVPPRDAFLLIQFERVWRVERLPGDNALWQSYRLAYAPKGIGQLYWDIEVALSYDGASNAC